MNEELQNAFDNIYDAKVPRSWLRKSWESSTLGFWFTELIDRNKQFSVWLFKVMTRFVLLRTFESIIESKKKLLRFRVLTFRKSENFFPFNFPPKFSNSSNRLDQNRSACLDFSIHKDF